MTQEIQRTIDKINEFHFTAWSPNFGARDDWVTEPSCTVVHYTRGGRARGSARWLQNPDSGASCHAVLSRAGRRYDVVPMREKAWHAGLSEWFHNGEMTGDVNEYSIGVELSNYGPLTKKNGIFYYELGQRMWRYHGPDPVPRTLVYDNGVIFTAWWEPYPTTQIDALKRLLDEMAKNGYETAANNLVGHEEIAMPLGRKRDPGPMFPWGEFGRRPDRTKSMP